MTTTVSSISKFCKDQITFYETITDFTTPATNDDVLLSLVPAWDTVAGTANTPLITFNSVNSGAGSARVVLRNIHNPELDNDAATKAYVDGLAVSGVSWKNTAISASTANITPFPPTDGITTVTALDGVATVVGQRVLIKDQTSAIENGIYEITAGTWTRTADMPTGISTSGFAVWVDQGALSGDKGYVITSDTGSDVADTDPIVWAKFSSSQGVAGADGDIQFALNGGHKSATTGTLNWDDTNSLLTIAGDAIDENALLVTVGDLSLTEGDIHLATGATTGNIKFGSNLIIGNDGTNSSIAHASSGDLILSSSGTTSDQILRLGDDAGVTSHRFQNSALVDILKINSDGVITQSLGSSTLNDTIPLYLGTDNDLTFMHSGTAASLTNTTGALNIVQSDAGSDLNLENTTADDMSFKLGANTTANSFNFVGDSQGSPNTLVQIVALEEESTSLSTGTLRVTGGGAFTGDVSAMCFNTLSDATTKTNISPIGLSDPLAKIRQIEGFNYNFLPGYGANENKLNTGVLAQQLETVKGLEHCVTTDANTGYKSVNYIFLIPMLIESIKSLAEKVEKKRVNKQ